jgi:hypothetical protein
VEKYQAMTQFYPMTKVGHDRGKKRYSRTEFASEIETFFKA